MPSTPLLIDKLRQDFTDIHFDAGDQFEWNPNERTIVYDPEDISLDAHLLHELSHALLNHRTYQRDIDLIAMERDAWQHARMELAPRYSIAIEGTVIDHDMDTYRNWLHERSTCPYCQSNGIQTKQDVYQCVTCRKTWRVNEARTCLLRRYKVSP